MDDWAAFDASLAREAARVASEAAALPLVVARIAEADARRRVSTHPTWKKLRRSIRADRVGPYAADVGYVARGQGLLGHIAEDGSARKAPHPAVRPASVLAERQMHALAAAILGRLQ